MGRSPHNAQMSPELLRDCLDDLDRGLLQRDAAVRLALLAALAGEHVLLIGPPGTAKSELARRLHHVFSGARYFERLLTRFSVPEELFGPLSLKALEDDRYERLTQGFLPTAHVAFLDEVFKANSAILNALLTLLNEREFDNGSRRVRVPLITVVGATNEVPDDDSLHAFYDRFLVRVPVEPVDDAHFARLLALPGVMPPPRARLTRDAIEILREGALDVHLPSEVLERLVEAREWCRAQNIVVSDRRWRKLVQLLQVQAASRGDRDVSPWDLWLLPFVLATLPAQVKAMSDGFMQGVARAVPLDAQWLMRAIEAFEKQLDIEQSAPLNAGDDSAGKLALARAMAGPDADQGLVRMVSDRARRRYSPLHVEARLTQVAEMRERAQAALQTAQAVGRAAVANAQDHLWLPPQWQRQIVSVHQGNETGLHELLDRLDALRQGFEALPVDPALAGPAPDPMPVPVAP